jgi:hypothetical protein
MIDLPRPRRRRTRSVTAFARSGESQRTRFAFFLPGNSSPENVHSISLKQRDAFSVAFREIRYIYSGQVPVSWVRDSGTPVTRASMRIVRDQSTRQTNEIDRPPRLWAPSTNPKLVKRMSPPTVSFCRAMLLETWGLIVNEAMASGLPCIVSKACGCVEDLVEPIRPDLFPAVRCGGPIRSVHGLTSALAAKGHDVHVYTTNVDGEGVLSVPVDQPTQLDGVTVWYFETSVGRRLYRSTRMREALALNVASFDILHLHSVFLWPTSAAAQAARRAGVPYVLSPRGMLVGDLIRRRSLLAKRTWIALFERRNIEEAAAVHLTSEIEAAELNALRFRCARLAVVANGIELPCRLRDGDSCGRFF